MSFFGRVGPIAGRVGVNSWEGFNPNPSSNYNPDVLGILRYEGLLQKRDN
jgi:hypothetical protein